MKNLGWILLIIGGMLLVRQVWPRTVTEKEIVTIPAVPETVRVELPAETSKVFIVQHETINSVITRTVFDTVYSECQSLEPRRRIVAGTFGEFVGDTTRVVSELMWGDTLGIGFQQTTEEIFNRGMIGKIGIDREGVIVEFVPFPVERINECTLWQQIPPALVGAGGGIVIGSIF